MRIAQVAPLFEAVPPKLYGGTERVVSWLTEELVAMGHEVTLFASGDSLTRGRLDAVWPRAIRLDPSVKDWVAAYHVMMERVAQRAGDFDIIHFHTDYFPFSTFSRLGTPFVTTLHGRLDLPEFVAVYGLFPEVPVVSISDAQRAPLGRQNWVGTVPHGLPPTLLAPVEAPRDHLAFLGRVSPEKGLARAIEIAGAVGMRLRVAAKVDTDTRAYFEAVIQPLLAANPRVDFIGEISDAQKPGFLSGAAALLFPIDWPEPFGLVMIEAMACGTPVLAFRHGSVPEVLDEGVSGHIVDSVADAIATLPRTIALDRAAVRARFEARFTARRMAADYLGVYARVIAAG